MAITVQTKNGGHEWEKVNLVTQWDSKRKPYDTLRCKCGVEGRSYTLDSVRISGSYSTDKVLRCPMAKPEEKPKIIEVIQCDAVGDYFNNLIPKSRHKVVEPPSGESGGGGVWVMGTDRKVKLLHGEYKVIES